MLRLYVLLTIQQCLYNICATHSPARMEIIQTLVSEDSGLKQAIPWAPMQNCKQEGSGKVLSLEINTLP